MNSKLTESITVVDCRENENRRSSLVELSDSGNRGRRRNQFMKFPKCGVMKGVDPQSYSMVTSTRNYSIEGSKNWP
jgi:hypothetical protein